MDRARIRLAAQLLLKADSTNAEPEAAALVERTYRLLAEIINQYDAEVGHAPSGPRRRERRFLRDRRGDRRGKQASEPAASRASASALQAAVRVDPAALYGRNDGPSNRSRTLDLEL